MGHTRYGKGEAQNQFVIPCIFGLYTNVQITPENAMDYHAWDDCPIGLPVNLKPKATLADLVATCPQRDVPTWDTDYFD